MSDDEEIPQLAPDTLAILQQFLEEKSKEGESEDWQLSQFWYDEKTTITLVNAVKKLSNNGGKTALICCPTLMQPALDRGIDAVLFEFDKRFSKFEDRFNFYNYQNPTDIDSRFHHAFDIVIADPPFLSEECLSKALETVDLLRKCKTTPVILCTGAVMENLALEIGQLKRCSFLPTHRNNLANEFYCYTNFGELPLS